MGCMIAGLPQTARTSSAKEKFEGSRAITCKAPSRKQIGMMPCSTHQAWVNLASFGDWGQVQGKQVLLAEQTAVHQLAYEKGFGFGKHVTYRRTCKHLSTKNRFSLGRNPPKVGAYGPLFGVLPWPDSPSPSSSPIESSLAAATITAAPFFRTKRGMLWVSRT